MLDMNSARWYLWLLIGRHACVIVTLTGFLLLTASSPSGVASAVGAVCAVAGVVGWSLSVSVLVAPLVWRSLRGTHPSMTKVLASFNDFTGHALIPQASEVTSGFIARLEPTHAPRIVGVEVCLFVLLLVIAII